MKTRQFNLISSAAIIAAIIFFIYSIVQLVGYGLSTGAISSSLGTGTLKNIITFLSSNFKGIASSLLAILLITTTIIYLGFLSLSNKFKSTAMKAASYTILIVNALVLLLTLSAYLAPSIYHSINLSINTANIILGIVDLAFGIILIIWKNKNPLLTKSLGILYILEGVMLITILFSPIRISDFTIAIRILEAFLFSKAAQKL